ncbi:4-coumarate-coA ligase [Aspergillus sclerotialis]|uniref:4-coumarate-coA ligase n=1 Tax=Aspergillus sclerotialis TaxID=2070753 RepID=A0A3A2ZRA2_9EURO|nr:4-coumarate-coA ligase [Aspergillus sclerotialis]
MIYLPEKDYNIPNIDLLTLLFESDIPNSPETTILHAEAADPTNAITKAQTRLLTRQIAYILRTHFDIGRHGAGKDVVLGVSTGQVLLPTVFYGVIAAGGIWSAASHTATAPELERQIRHGNSSVVITGSDNKEAATKAARDAGVPLDRILELRSKAHERALINVATGKNYLAGLGSSEVLDWEQITDPKELKDSLICLLYSSGTTGPPKGVELSHQNLVSEALIPTFMDREFEARKKAEDPNFSEPYRTLAHLPTAHIAGCLCYFVFPALAAGTVYWMEKFDFPKFLEYNKSLEITYFFTVPPIFLLISQSPLVTDQFRTLQRALTGAAPMSADLQKKAQEKVGCLINQTWGLSETTGSMTIMPRETEELTGSISRLLPNVRLRIVDEDGVDVQEGKEGEFIVKGPIVTNGYYLNEQATKESFTVDGWFKTGDIGLRKNGLFYIVDRKKELIKYKGLQVAPAELEALLLSHPLIMDAAVIGVPATDGSGNEVPRAYIVADEKKISADQVKEFVKSKLAHYKQLRGGVIYLPAIPKSPSGKILRRELRDQAKREQKSKL